MATDLSLLADAPTPNADAPRPVAEVPEPKEVEKKREFGSGRALF